MSVKRKNKKEMLPGCGEWNRCGEGNQNGKGRTMKIMAQMAVIGALIGLGATGVNAQPTTNADLMVNVSLSGVAQTASNVTTRVKVINKDLLTALGTATSTTFSSRARLLLRFPLSGDSPVFVVRDVVGGTNVDTVISSGVLGIDSSPSGFDTHVRTETSKGTVTSDNEVFILRVAFNQGANPSFFVQGYTTATSDDRGNPGNGTTPTKASASMAGIGTTTDGSPAVLQGKMILSGRKIQASAE